MSVKTIIWAKACVSITPRLSAGYRSKSPYRTELFDLKLTSI